MPVTLYRWNSEYLKNYSLGDILVAALDVETARNQARALFEKHVVGRYFWMFQSWNLSLDEDDQECMDRYRALFEEDISAEPEVSELNAFFI